VARYKRNIEKSASTEKPRDDDETLDIQKQRDREWPGWQRQDQSEAAIAASSFFVSVGQKQD
jgi:hypothetical protein